MRKLLALTLFLIGCSTTIYHKAVATASNTRHIPVYIDRSFSKTNSADIISSVSSWNYSLNGFITLDLISTTFDMEVSIIEEIYHNQNGILILNKPDGAFDESWLAWTDHQNHIDHIDGHTINILSNKIHLRNKNMRRIVMHEIGHALSADDNTILNTLMNKNTNFESNCIDEEVILQLQKKLHLNPAQTNYCKILY